MGSYHWDVNWSIVTHPFCAWDYGGLKLGCLLHVWNIISFTASFSVAGITQSVYYMLTVLVYHTNMILHTAMAISFSLNCLSIHFISKQQQHIRLPSHCISIPFPCRLLVRSWRKCGKRLRESWQKLDTLSQHKLPWKPKGYSKALRLVQLLQQNVNDMTV